MQHGQGTYTWSDGHKYVGEYKDDKKHGQGTFTYANGEKYVGEFKDDLSHGQGTLRTPSGEKIVGEFKENRPWNGIYYDSDGSVIGKISDGELME